MSQLTRQLCDELYKHKRDNVGNHIIDLLVAPDRKTKKEVVLEHFRRLRVKDLDAPRSVHFYSPAEYFDPNFVLPLGRLKGLDWVQRLQVDYFGRPYDHFKSIPCITNSAIQIRCLERAAPAGTYPHAIWRTKEKTSAMFEEMNFVAGTIIARKAMNYVHLAGEVGNQHLHVHNQAVFKVEGTIGFSKVMKMVWGNEDTHSNGMVAGVLLPTLAAGLEQGTSPCIQLGDVVRVDVEGSPSGWLILVKELFEPDTARGSFLCVGKGCRLWTEEDVKTLPFCEEVELTLHSNEVLLSQWTVSFQVRHSKGALLAIMLAVLYVCDFQTANIKEVFKSLKAWAFRDPKHHPACKELVYKVCMVTAQHGSMDADWMSNGVQSFFDIAELQVKAIRLYDEAAAYLKHERLMYTLKNGNWGRSRDYFVDTVYHSLLAAMVMYPSRYASHQLHLVGCNMLASNAVCPESTLHCQASNQYASLIVGNVHVAGKSRSKWTLLWIATGWRCFQWTL